jgi:membrane protease YdiL (CAAX protease family)
VENSLRSQTLQDSPVVFPPNAFWWFSTIVFLIGIAFVFFVAMAIGMAYYGISHGLDLMQTARAMTGMAGVTIQTIAEIVIIAYILLLLPSIAKVPLQGLGFRPLSSAQMGVILLGAVAMFVVVTPFASLLQTLLHFKQQEEAIAVFTHATGWQRFAFVLFGVVFAPAFEEAVFRLVLFNAMRKWWGLVAGAIVSSILFGLAHSQPPITPAMFACIAFPLALGGLVLCYVYARTNNAWASFLTHGIFNGFTFALLMLFPQLAK